MTDSASAGTTIFSGVKTADATLGAAGGIRMFNCSSMQGQEISTIGTWATAAGKSVGIVTTTRITHATPAALYAHTPHRDWESDADLSNKTLDAELCVRGDIARQLIENDLSRQITVLL